MGLLPLKLVERWGASGDFLEKAGARCFEVRRGFLPFFFNVSKDWLPFKPRSTVIIGSWETTSSTSLCMLLLHPRERFIEPMAIMTILRVSTVLL